MNFGRACGLLNIISLAGPDVLRDFSAELTEIVARKGRIENLRLRAQIDHSGAITISDYHAYVTQKSFGASDATQTTLWSHDDDKAQARENFRSMDPTFHRQGLYGYRYYRRNLRYSYPFIYWTSYT